MPRRDPSGEYEFRLNCPSAHEVVLVGDFHARRVSVARSPEEVPMSPSPSGDWRCRLNLPEGVYQFGYRVDGNWCLEEEGCATAAPSFLTSSLIVRDEEVPADAYMG